ncbi:hypothetical protein KC207_07915 [Phycicoccus sp. BSK3Z-2]|uniref:Secreted protein n=1 Tax=Phycicoccus avicenniae TaxID=2828860 RepID=A0A941HYP6_9MICO|nr:hypothetical protein [Phycicoccus avicenniae]MBR7743213.1 hypothetical protein [Phycicoccus avicenniae]
MPSRHRILATLAAACALGLTGATGAQAVTWEYDVAQLKTIPSAFTCNRTVDESYGKGCYDRSGDIFWVWDQQADAQSVGIIWKTTSGRQGVCRHAGGASGADYWNKRQCNKNLPENRTVTFRIGRCDKTATRSCKHPSHYTNTSAWVSSVT